MALIAAGIVAVVAVAAGIALTRNPASVVPNQALLTTTLRRAGLHEVGSATRCIAAHQVKMLGIPRKMIGIPRHCYFALTLAPTPTETTSTLSSDIAETLLHQHWKSRCAGPRPGEIALVAPDGRSNALLSPAEDDVIALLSSVPTACK